jgi:uncharacterized membrane protein YGL010W
MIDLFLNRTTVISLAVIGGAFSVLASWCRSRSLISEQKAVWLNKAAYVLMAASIILFIGAGLFEAGN